MWHRRARNSLRADWWYKVKFALVNPPWSFEGSIYFGCREPHLPLEYGYSKALLERAGHEAIIVDAQLETLPAEEVRTRVSRFAPDFTVITTAPSYLFWRCAPPELRVPREIIEALHDIAGTLAVVGPHGSTTPRTTLRKLSADVVVLGECEEVLPRLAGDWDGVASLCFRRGDEIRINGGPAAARMDTLGPLTWAGELLARHRHHHHRFDAAPKSPGAEVEASRGCPYHCTFCAKDNFRDDYRRRPLPALLEEIDGLLAAGAEYVYFIDEIFLPNQALLEALAARALKFGVQTRIDLWNHEMLELLGRAGCVSIEAGVESITEEGRQLLDKKCRLSTGELADRLIFAKRRVPFVQANLLEMTGDDAAGIEAWREHLIANGVWANRPVPLFAYPGSPEYTRRWGDPDDVAWERAHADYLRAYEEFSDIQEQRPAPLIQLERS
jgi:B12-binding domain/radical SAM domain protein of rhizo-twelve system